MRLWSQVVQWPGCRVDGVLPGADDDDARLALCGGALVSLIVACAPLRSHFCGPLLFDRQTGNAIRATLFDLSLFAKKIAWLQ